MKASLDEAREAYEKASPMSRVHPEAPPFFVIHGDSDTLVPVREAREFAALLRQHAAQPGGLRRDPRRAARLRDLPVAAHARSSSTASSASWRTCTATHLRAAASWPRPRKQGLPPGAERAPRIGQGERSMATGPLRRHAAADQAQLGGDPRRGRGVRAARLRLGLAQRSSVRHPRAAAPDHGGVDDAERRRRGHRARRSSGRWCRRSASAIRRCWRRWWRRSTTSPTAGSSSDSAAAGSRWSSRATGSSSRRCATRLQQLDEAATLMKQMWSEAQPSFTGTPLSHRVGVLRAEAGAPAAAA